MNTQKDKEKKVKDEKLDNTKNRIKELEDKVVELENNWKRALADYRNLEKRFAEEKEIIVKFANATLVMSLLPVLDNLEMMKEHIDDTGLKMISKEFERILEDEGVTEIEAKDMDFDTNIMEAIEKVDGEKGKVVEVVKKGYRLGDKVIRPAGVRVGNGESCGDVK